MLFQGKGAGAGVRGTAGSAVRVTKNPMKAMSSAPLNAKDGMMVASKATQAA